MYNILLVCELSYVSWRFKTSYENSNKIESSVFRIRKPCILISYILSKLGKYFFDLRKLKNIRNKAVYMEKLYHYCKLKTQLISYISLRWVRDSEPGQRRRCCYVDRSWTWCGLLVAAVTALHLHRSRQNNVTAAEIWGGRLVNANMSRSPQPSIFGVISESGIGCQISTIIMVFRMFSVLVCWGWQSSRYNWGKKHWNVAILLAWIALYLVFNRSRVVNYWKVTNSENSCE